MTARKINSAPPGVFKGNNFMTPAVEADYETTYRGEKVYVELSTGRGMSNEPIYGVTVRRTDGTRFGETVHEDPSHLFHSRADALEYINGLETDDE